jgi:MOSC domain-containing protein YiiM
VGPLAPGELRRNIVTRGIRLNELVGRVFWIADVLCRGRELASPAFISRV